MNRFTTYLIAASFALSGATLFAADTGNANNMNTGANSAAAQMGTSAVRSGNELQSIGSQQADASTSREVRSSLAQVVNDALTPNRFSDLSSHLAKSDQKRFSNASSVKADDLNRAVNQFRQDFHSKYGQDFDARASAFQDTLVYSGQDKNSATVALHDVSTGNAANQSSSFSSNAAASNNNEGMNNSMKTDNTPGHAPADRQLNTYDNSGTQSNRNGMASGSDLSSATLGNRTGPASSGSNSNTTVRGDDINANPGVATGNKTAGQQRQDLASSTTTPPAGEALTLNMVNEGNSWKIDLPDQISDQQLKDNLARHIQTLDDQKSTWPSDVNQAYRTTAYHVLRAFNDTAMASER
ncbi:MAG TPA: hypothetical protein VH253_00290 [Phycisphaerae bacterium]|nr:hypothetical protein [Phycisphaerae bacterium]